MARQIVKTLEEAQVIWPMIPFHTNTIDLTNQTFNYLTGLYKTNNLGPNTGSYWVFKCKCGNYVKIKSSDVRTGKTKSCGCYQKEQISKSCLKDLTGQRFGKLTVLSRDLKYKKENKWICQCECGNITSVYSVNLINNRTKSCGCLNKEKKKDITNYQSGYLIALEPTDIRKNDNVVWKCKCTHCGNICYVRESSIIGKYQKSCGCIQSYGEQIISNILKENNIKFEKQKTFNSCRFPDTNYLAKFDFYLPDYNTLIEYDGRQHEMGWDNTKIKSSTKEMIQKRDNFKNEWCKKNNIILIRIPYTHQENIIIDELLPQTSHFIYNY